MSSWKTLLFGLILASGSILKPIIEKRPPTAEEILVIAGAAGLGHSAKDKDVTGVGVTARRVSSGE